jgi:hypothetical protein
MAKDDKPKPEQPIATPPRPSGPERPDRPGGDRVPHPEHPIVEVPDAEPKQ